MTETLNEETGELTRDDEDAIAAEMSPDDEDGELELELELEPESAPPSGPSEREVEQAFKKVEQRASTYAKAVGEALNFMADDLAPCVLCAGTPHPAFLNVRAAGTMPQETKRAVMAYLGYAAEQDYEPDPQTEECRICKGKGMVATGSLVPNNEARNCRNCNGYGYYPPPDGATSADAPADVLHAPAGEAAVPLDASSVDPSGEPRILPDGRPNPNFGLWPQYKVQVAPYGTTAGLTAQDAPGQP